MVDAEENRHDEVEHNLQMWLIPDRAGTQFRLPPAEAQRRGTSRAIQALRIPDGREGSMPINTDARIYAGLFSSGGRIEHALEPLRGAWVQVVRGTLRVAGATLNSGDGVGITGLSELRFQFDANSEGLLFDVRMDTPLIWR